MQKSTNCHGGYTPEQSTTEHRKQTHSSRALLSRPVQMFRKMKFTTLICLVCCLHISAKSVSQTVTFSGRDVRLKEVFAAIKQQTGYTVFYNQELLVNTKPVAFSAKAMPLKEFLEEALKEQPLDFSINNQTRTIVLSRKPLEESTAKTNQALQTDFPMNGVIINSSGEPLGGASIRIKRKDTGATANADGSFVINVDVGDVLAVSFLGYLTLEIKITDSKEGEVIAAQQQVAGNLTHQSSLINGPAGGLIITLATAVTELAEATVNTGYQRISRERSTGSYAKPEMEVVQNRTTSPNIIERLDGLVPGLSINLAPAGANDRRNNSILVRGLSTMNANAAPLFVVDGVPMENVSSINPQDVADVSILKDAVATSVWGARASNGVIVITTKKGTQGDKIRIDYDGYVNVQGRPRIDYFPMMNSEQYIRFSRETFDPENWTYAQATTYNPSNARSGISPDRQILYDMHRGAITQQRGNAMLDSLAGIDNTQALRDMYENAYITNHTVSLLGGFNKYAFYGSLAYTGMNSSTPGTDDKTYKVNLRQDFTFNRWLKAFLITDLTNQIGRSDRSITPDNRFVPYQLFRDGGGNSLDMSYLGFLSEQQRPMIENATGVDLSFNPIDHAHSGFTNNNRFVARLNSGVTVSLWDGLRYEGIYGLTRMALRGQVYDDVRTNYHQRFMVATFYDTNAGVYRLPNSGGQYQLSNTTTQDWTVRNQLVYDKEWQNNLHQLTVMAGQEAQAFRTINNNSAVMGYDLDLQTYARLDYLTLANVGAQHTAIPYDVNGSKLLDYLAMPGYRLFGQHEVETRFRSYYATAGYTYDYRYSINASWRNDQSNLFGNSAKASRKPIWSVGGKWILSNESFVRDASWLSMLALRATYGVTGNSPIPGSGASVDVLQPFISNITAEGVALRIATPGNPDLSWEPTTTFNVGLDFAVLGSRLSGSVDYYQRNTVGLLSDMNVNPATGKVSIFGNIGDMKNNGVEVSLTGVNIRNANFEWSTSLNFAYNKNEITSINLLVPIVTGSQQINALYTPNNPAFSLFTYHYGGLDNTGEPMVFLADGSHTGIANEVLKDDVGFAGVFQQPWSGGLANMFRYKAFSLSANIIFNLGHRMRTVMSGFPDRVSGHYLHSPLSFQGGNREAFLADRWKAPGDEISTNIPKYNALTGVQRHLDLYQSSDINIADASFAKLRDINLSYNLPSGFIQRYGMDQVLFRIQVSNVMLWRANNLGIDPEFHDARLGYMVAPANQNTVTLGLHLTF